jgi:hypothetical protein
MGAATIRDVGNADSAAAILAASLSLSASALAEPWSGPDPARRPDRIGAGDIDFAVAEICFPFVLQNASIDAVTDRPFVLRMDRPPEFARGATAFIVGQADVIVALRDETGSRSCTVRIRDGNAQRYREILGRRLAQMPVPLTPAARQIDPNEYAAREVLCGPPGPPHDGVLISVGGKSRRTPSLMVTIVRSATRSARCDAATRPAEPARQPDVL